MGEDLLSVFQWMSYSRQAARLLRPSTRTRRRISAQFSMSVYTPASLPVPPVVGLSASIVGTSRRVRPRTPPFSAARRPPPGAALSRRRSHLPGGDARLGGPHRAPFFYGTTRRRKAVEFTPALRSRVESAARRCHELFEARVTPRVARHKGCDRCSLLELCLPDVTGAQTPSASPPKFLTRCVELPEDPLSNYHNTLFVTTPRHYLAKDHENVAVRVDHQTRLSVPMHHLGGVVCFGPVSASPELMAACFDAASVCRSSTSTAASSRTSRARHRAMSCSAAPVPPRRRPAGAGRLARWFIIGKVANARSMLVR